MKTFEEDIKKCTDKLITGGAILYPTDTIWGLGCDATDSEAVLNVSKIKNRPMNKSFVVLVADTEMLQNYLQEPIGKALNLINSLHDPTTIIYEKVKGISDQVLAVDGSVGIRIPNDKFCNELIKSFGKPIVSTSANLSGQPSPQIFSEIQEELKKKVDYIANWRQEDKVPKQASRILKMNSDGTTTRIR